MNSKQKLSPKYWVGHNKKSDDVIIATANKARASTLKDMELLLGEDWYFDEDYEVILVEIKEVDTN